MNTLSKLIFAAIISFTSVLPSKSLAAPLVDCGARVIQNVWITATREDAPSQGNMILVKLDGAPCNGLDYVYLENTDQAFPSVYEGIMRAFDSGMRVHMFVNPSTTLGPATQIAHFGLLK